MPEPRQRKTVILFYFIARSFHLQSVNQNSDSHSMFYATSTSKPLHPRSLLMTTSLPLNATQTTCFLIKLRWVRCLYLNFKKLLLKPPLEPIFTVLTCSASLEGVDDDQAQWPSSWHQQTPSRSPSPVEIFWCCALHVLNQASTYLRNSGLRPARTSSEFFIPNTCFYSLITLDRFLNTLILMMDSHFGLQHLSKVDDPEDISLVDRNGLFPPDDWCNDFVRNTVAYSEEVRPFSILWLWTSPNYAFRNQCVQNSVLLRCKTNSSSRVRASPE